MRMFQKCEDLFSFSVHSLQDLDCLDQLPFAAGKSLQQTGVDQQELVAPTLPSRSAKRLTPPCDISFEKDMLREHRGVFAAEYRNYIEFGQGQIEGGGVCGQAEGGRGTAGEGVLLGVEELLGGRVGLGAEEKRQFGKDLEHEVNLRVFLDFVCATCAPPNAERLVLLAREVWLAFVPYQQSHFDITDLLELAEQIADGALESSPGLLPTSHPVPRENSLKLRKFIEIYCATVILVITEYFQNPYFVEEGGEAKRPLVFDFSDSEESEVSFSSPLVKKRKMSALFLNK